MIFTTRCAGCDTPGAPICTTCRFALSTRVPLTTAAGVEAAMAYTGRARDVLLGFKYRNRRQVARHLAGCIVNRLLVSGDLGRIDVVTWAPTSRRRRRERGFDQGEMLARYVARQLGRPVRPLLQRSDEPTQTGRSRRQRLDGVHFRAHPRVAGRTVLVIDDVVTTGATLRAATAALEAAGAGWVRTCAVAATPAPVAAAERRQPARRAHLRAVA
ncbi:MAG: phosphoribosyltransferase family protein [Actinomycetota bacterium]